MENRVGTREEYQKRINKVIDYINAHLDEPLNLNTLSSISCLSPYHFHRITRAFLHEPIGAYISRLRVEKAAERLRFTTLSIEEIAYSVGYDMPSSLSKVFKQFYNVSPTEFRNQKIEICMKKLENTLDLNIKGPKFVELPEKTALYVRLTGDYGKNDYGQAWQKLWQQVKEQQLFTKGIEHLGVSHDDPNITENSKLRYDACLVIHKPAKAVGEVGVRTIEGGKYACFLYQGSYSKLDQVYDQVYYKWLASSGLELRDAPCFDKYISHPDRVAEEKIKTEIYVPIK